MHSMLTAIITAAAYVAPAGSQASQLPYAIAQAPPQERPAIDSARRVLVEGMRRSGIPGAAVTVMRDGRVVWSEGFGFADTENRVPVTTLTRFRIGSVSKPLRYGGARRAAGGG